MHDCRIIAAKMKPNSFFIMVLASILLFCSIPLYAIDPLPTQAPLNPEFIDWLNTQDQEKLQSKSMSTVKDVTGSFGYIPPPVDWSHLSNQRATKTTVFEKLGAPVSYDLRDFNLVSPVKNQGSCGSCWAFATMGSLESAVLKQSGVTWDFSEQNLKNTHGFVWGHCDGGNTTLSTSYLTRWAGPVDESDDPYDINISTSLPGLPLKKIVRSVLKFNGREDFKNAIMNYGAIQVSYYHNDSYYNSSDTTYYCPDLLSTNHAVTCIGWDDNKVTAAPTTGAWLIKNSWGTGFGNNGYFWIAYDDATINDIADSYCNPAEPSTYSRSYQYDTYGYTSSVGYSNETAWGANIFTAAADEELIAVAFHALAHNTSYEIYIYDEFDTGTGTFSSLLGSTFGTISNAGYHTISLPSAIALTSGDEFGIVVKFVTPGYPYPVPLEKNISSFLENVIVNGGESYISSNGSSFSNRTDANVCIKGFVKGDGLIPPTIFDVLHTPSDPTDADNVSVTAGITDDGDIISSTLRWCTDGILFGHLINMSLVSGNTYQTDTDIPAQSYGTTVSYKITAVDNDTKTTTSPIYNYSVLPPSYCDAGGIGDVYNNKPSEYISNVQVGDINNSSTETASLSPNPNYTDYTGISTDMIIGNGYSFTVSIDNPWNTDQVLIWIDWNQDLDFDDTGEEVFVSSTGRGPFTGTITPPSGAVPGNTRMRIRLHDAGSGPNASPCGTSSWGEVEDYTVNVRCYYNLTITAVNGSVSKTPDQTFFLNGTIVTLEAIPNTGYLFNDWSSDLSGPDNPTTITMDSDKSVIANFIQLGTITISGINMGADVYIHATNGWQGTKARDESGIITDLKPGTHILTIKETGNRTELVSATVSAGDNTDVPVTLRNVIPYIFTAKTAVEDDGDIPIDPNIYNSAVLDDIDKDGDVDLVVAEADGDIHYYLEAGSGFKFNRTQQVSLGTGETVKCIRCVDIGGDGERELIVGLSTGEMFSLDMADGDRTAFYDAGSGLTGFDLFEGNDDDHPDMLLGYGNGYIKRAVSTGSGAWASAEDVTSGGGSSLNVGSDATPLAMDLDGDGIKDLLAGNQDGDVLWFKGDGTLEYTARGSVNSSGEPLTASGSTALSMGYNTTMNDLPYIIITDTDGNVYQSHAILLGDVDSDNKVFIEDFSIFVESWGLDDDNPGWNADANFDVTPNGSGDQEIDISDFTLFNDSWRKEK